MALHRTVALMEATPSGTLPRSSQSPGVIVPVGAAQRRMLNLQSLSNDGESPHLPTVAAMACRIWQAAHVHRFPAPRRRGTRNMHMLIPNARSIEPVLVTPMKFPPKNLFWFTQNPNVVLPFRLHAHASCYAQRRVTG
jgi:hypothetical protein